jgi:hypothetical protein
LGGTIVRAASEIWLGALPTARRAISASLSGVAKGVAAATWSSVERAGAEGVVERGQVAERVAGLRDALRGAVVAARELCEPLGAGRAACGLPVAAVVGLAHELGGALLEARLLGKDRQQLAPTRHPLPLQRMIDDQFCCTEHMFV